MRYLASTARASAKVEGSGTVGPEAMTAGSSPGTSEIAKVTICAPGAAAAASRPPLIAERCLRTVLISPIVAPERSKARVTCLLVRERQAGRGEGQQRRAAARNEADKLVIGPEAAREIEDALRGALAGSVGHRVARLDDLDPLAGHGMAVAGDDEPAQFARPRRLERARHRRRGLAGADDHRAARNRRSGSAAATARRGSEAASAASNSARRNSRGATRSRGFTSQFRLAIIGAISYRARRKDQH